VLIKLDFSRKFFKSPQILNPFKIRSLGVELSHADGQTDTTKLTFAFRNFANAPKTRVVEEESKIFGNAGGEAGRKTKERCK
jgi:hypothetical protein